jgi:hypothetical protein
MQCELCGGVLDKDQVNNFRGKVFCEDCCFDLLNPPKVCDPPAISSTLTVRKHLGQVGTEGLSEMQKQIYAMVISKGKVSKDELSIMFKLTPLEIEKQFATLRHCELLRAQKENSTVYLTKY